MYSFKNNNYVDELFKEVNVEGTPGKLIICTHAYHALDPYIWELIVKDKSHKDVKWQGVGMKGVTPLYYKNLFEHQKNENNIIFNKAITQDRTNNMIIALKRGLNVFLFITQPKLSNNLLKIVKECNITDLYLVSMKKDINVSQMNRLSESPIGLFGFQYNNSLNTLIKKPMIIEINKYKVDEKTFFENKFPGHDYEILNQNNGNKAYKFLKYSYINNYR